MNRISFHTIRGIFVIYSLLIASIYSCKKESSPVKSNPLTSGVWNLQKIELSSSTGSWYIPDPSEPTDNNQITYTFASNGSFTETDDGKNLVGTWILSSDQMQLTLNEILDSDITFTYIYTVTVLNSSTLQLVQPLASPNFSRLTYTH